MGDSVITETAGWGGLIMSNSMALSYVVGATPQEAFSIAEQNAKLTTAESTLYKVPSLGYRGAPIGIDVRKVAVWKQAPILNTGIVRP